MEAVGLQSKQDLKVWERLILVAGEGHDAGRFLARIEDFINNGIVVSQPERIAGNVALRDNAMVRVQFTRPDAAYEFDSRLIVRRRDNGTYCLLTPARSLRRVQRRRFCRIELSSDVDYQVISADWEWQLQESDAAWTTARTVDVSAGGLLMLCREEIHSSTTLLLRPDLFRQNGLPKRVLGTCRRSYSTDAGTFIGLEFVHAGDVHRVLGRLGKKSFPEEILRFDQRAQDRLSHLLFDIQIERRSKGLL